jgi:DNA-binding NtrC family response regulator
MSTNRSSCANKPDGCSFQATSPLSDELALGGKAILIVEDEPLISMMVESGLRDAGADAIEIVRSVASAKALIGGGVPFDAAVIDLHVADGDASPLIESLAARGTLVVVTTGGSFSAMQPDLSKAVAVLHKPYPEGDLIKIIACMVK